MTSKPSRILIVEGKTDAAFFTALQNALGYKGAIEIRHMKGKTALRELLLEIRDASVNEGELTHLAIVLDNDKSPDGTAQSIRDALRAHRFSVPPEPLAWGKPSASSPATMFYTLPDPESRGALEGLCLRFFQAIDPQGVGCVQDYLIRCTDGRSQYVDDYAPYDKAKLQAFLAIWGNGTLSLENAVKQPQWDWYHPVFEGVQQFIHQLATEQPA